MSPKKTHWWPVRTHRVSISLIIREMQIKTTMRYHLTAMRTTIMKKLQSVSGKEGVEKREPTHTAGVAVTGCSHRREEKEGSLKTKQSQIRQPRSSAWIWKRWNPNSKRYMHLSVHSSTIYNSQDSGATQMSINRGMAKKDVAQIHNRILLSHKNE